MPMRHPDNDLFEKTRLRQKGASGGGACCRVPRALKLTSFPERNRPPDGAPICHRASKGKEDPGGNSDRAKFWQ
jgi:hypothetical protein